MSSVSHILACEQAGGHKFDPASIKFAQNVCLVSCVSSIMGHIGSETRSAGMIVGKYFEHCRGQVFFQLSLQFDQNVCPDNLFDSL